MKNLGYINLRDIKDWGLLDILILNYKLQADLLQILGSLAVLEIVDDRVENGFRVSNSNERELSKMGKV